MRGLIEDLIWALKTAIAEFKYRRICVRGVIKALRPIPRSEVEALHAEYVGYISRNNSDR
jgi:hypothetical protein